MIRVVHEDIEALKQWGIGLERVVERCCLCNSPTRYWHLPTNNPVCQVCAANRTAAELRAKSEGGGREPNLTGGGAALPDGVPACATPSDWRSHVMAKADRYANVAAALARGDEGFTQSSVDACRAKLSAHLSAGVKEALPHDPEKEPRFHEGHD